jgi:hypothetical protein
MEQIVLITCSFDIYHFTVYVCKTVYYKVYRYYTKYIYLSLSHTELPYNPDHWGTACNWPT